MSSSEPPATAKQPLPKGMPPLPPAKQGPGGPLPASMPKFPPIPGARTVTADPSKDGRSATTDVYEGKVHGGQQNGLKNVAAMPSLPEE